MQTYLYSLLNSPSFSSAFASSASLAFLRPSLCSPPAAETLAASAVMASSNVSTVYISVIDDVISKVREDFITYGVGDAVLNELQALWEMKMLHCGAISGNIERTKAAAASAGGTSGTTPPVHDLNVPYEATSEEYATPTADMLFPPTPLQTPIQTPLPGTDTGMYNIPTGPSDYAPSPISDIRNGMTINGADPKAGRPSPYMPPPSPWMNQRPLGVDVNVAYVEGREDPDRGVQPQPLTQVKYEIANHLRAWIISNFVLGIPSVIYIGLSFISVEIAS
ncbi:Transcription factor IIA alpha/beta subunit [Zea mays]|uniref:Transcription factor IIA alpha/beta subunit n=1 Tax=Zea mays TaxID=4577 RepID=A0A1D6M0J9_MAIZE|nr:Transcription factor IIA alpha/beta subunit [Zea mays]